MEVHPPEHGIHSWRDFLIHMGTITLGLLIALGLEALVEYRHRQHLLHLAQHNLHAEIAVNRDLLAANEQALAGEEEEFTKDLQESETTGSIRKQRPVPMRFSWRWNGLSSTAWNAARDTGAIASMPYEQAVSYSSLITQQEVVDSQAVLFIRDAYRSESSLLNGRRLEDLSPADREALQANLRETLADLEHLRDLCRSLDELYKAAPQD